MECEGLPSSPPPTHYFEARLRVPRQYVTVQLHPLLSPRAGFWQARVRLEAPPGVMVREIEPQLDIMIRIVSVDCSGPFQYRPATIPDV
jgi:hypothetical protein